MRMFGRNKTYPIDPIFQFDRLLDILEELKEKGTLTIDEIAGILGYQRQTAYKYIAYITRITSYGKVIELDGEDGRNEHGIRDKHSRITFQTNLHDMR